MELKKPNIDYVKFYAVISLFFIVLGLSPISRLFSLFSFFDPEFYFVPQYMPYAISIVSAYAGIVCLRENKSKIFVAAMGGVFKANIAISIFMVGYFAVSYGLVLFGNATLPEYCVFPGDMNCQSAWLSTDDNRLYFSLVNGINRPIVVTHVSCTMNRNQFEPCSPGRCRGYDASKRGVLAYPGSAMGFTVSCNDETGKPLKFQKGDRYTGKLDIGFHYADEPAGNMRKTVGSVGAKGG